MHEITIHIITFKKPNDYKLRYLKNEEYCSNEMLSAYFLLIF